MEGRRQEGEGWSLGWPSPLAIVARNIAGCALLQSIFLAL